VLPRILLGIVAVGALCVGYGVIFEQRWYRMVRYRLDILPVEAPADLSVLHLSDLHVVRGERRMAAFLASLPPADVTVVTGDFLAEPEAVETAVETVRAVRGRLASWFVLGSNDLYTPRPLNPLLYFVPRSSRPRRRARQGRSAELVERRSSSHTAVGRQPKRNGANLLVPRPGESDSHEPAMRMSPLARRGGSALFVTSAPTSGRRTCPPCVCPAIRSS